jgi:pyruvate/2-oxoglutarate dehydrogenase complex dihydrolipoamide acyltransferase (E2) component
MALDAAASFEGVVTTVVVEVAGVVAAGGVIVVVDSSFLLQAANETAAARLTISNAVFIFLLDSGSSDNFRKLWEPLWSRTPSFKDKESCGISRA